MLAGQGGSIVVGDGPSPNGSSEEQFRDIMKLRKSICLVALVASFATCGYAQISWTSHSPAGISDDIWGVTYANGTFAAVTSGGRVLTSSDGLAWSSQVIDAGVWLLSIAYGNGEWVVVGDKGTILVSPDLKTWSLPASGTVNRLNGVLNNGIWWVAVGEGGTIVVSPDAQTWTLDTSVPSFKGYLRGITEIVGPTIGGVVRPNVNAIMICGQNGELIQGIGTSFDPIASPTTQDLNAVVSSNLDDPNLITVAAGAGGALINGPGFEFEGPYAVSPTPTPNVIFRGLAYGNGFYVAAGEQGTIFSSADGVNWTQRFSGESPSTLSTATLLAAAYSPTLQRFVVVGTGGTVLVSNSAPTVFGNVSTRGYVSATETFIGGFVVQGTAPRTVLIRGDGPVLSTFSVPSPLSDPVVTVYNSTGGVVATNTGWGTNADPTAISTAALEVGAFALPSSSADSALLLTLPPGAYTVQITSAKGNSGTALFEAYTD
jgi:hypothetical protein